MKQRAGLSELGAYLLKFFERGDTRYCFDAADAGRDAAFIDDFEEADIARAPDMGAATEFAAETGDSDNTDAIAVFLAKERHSACIESLIEVHDVGDHFGVCENLFVD